MKTTLLASALAFFAAAATAATSFSYQGTLRDANGNVLSERNKTITFKLYNDPTADDPLWTNEIAVLLDDEGLFNVELSDSAGGMVPETRLEDVLAENATRTLYIGLTVSGSSGEIRPRQKILPVPVASFAQNVACANGDFSVSGITTLSGPVNVQSNVTVDARTIVRSLTVDDGATITGGTTVNGSLSISDENVGLALAAGTPFTIGGVNAAIPKGVIVMWSGSAANVPAGWALCDGQDGRPDLRGRFILGAGTPSNADLAKQFSDAGVALAEHNAGGEVRHTLSVDEMPSHSHSMTLYGADLNASWDNDNYFYTTFAKYSGNKNTPGTSSAGGGKPHNNMPPFFTLCYIIKL